MSLLLDKRLPGVTFQTAPPPPDDALPRMDVAAFVGLAAAGPLHTPVPVEDVAEFRNIFGPDLPLAWDDANGRFSQAHLAPTIAAFFRNGGRRCWVVRVAGDAAQNRFVLPGLCAAGSWQPAIARARSRGSWCDDLRASATRRSRALAVRAFAIANGRLTLDVADDRADLQPGDLIQLAFNPEGLLCYLLCDTVTAVPAAQQLSGAGHWFASEPDEGELAAATAVFHHTPAGPISLPLLGCQWLGQRQATLHLNLPLAAAPPTGDLLRVTFADGQQLLFPVSGTPEIVDAEGTPALALTTQEALWPLASPPLPTGLPLADRLSIDLWLWREQTAVARLQELALSPDHPRAWTRLPLDETLYALTDGQPHRPPLDTLSQEASQPRFPLAGPESAAALYLPLGLRRTPDPENGRSPLIPPGAPLERNGLYPFTPDLFLDPDLGALGERTLLAEAHHKLYLRRQPLRGLHSLLPVAEVSLIALPDAAHPGWEEVATPPPTPLPAPTLQPIGQPDADGFYEVTWATVPLTTAYLLEEANEPTFAQPQRRYEGEETAVALLLPPGCPARFYYRVRARRQGEPGPWSNTEWADLPQPPFQPCVAPNLIGPHLAAPAPVINGYELTWTAVPPADAYTLQSATQPDFAAAATLYHGPNIAHLVPAPATHTRFYRVRAEQAGAIGPWSNTVWILPPAQHAWRMKRPSAAQIADLLASQQALLRFCAARGDALALLSLPATLRAAESASHARALTAHGEERTPSFGALFHPWLYLRPTAVGNQTAPLLLPPDGPIAGLIASRARRRGAWIAPANQPLSGVVALSPAFSRDDWADLLAVQVNLVCTDPRGFMTLSAETLSGYPGLQPISTRRLLILLRRLAQREGMAYVFQPNNAEFHRLVRHKFDRLLNHLYSRGAFAGETPAQAYQVVADATLNTRASLDQGRFIIELRVAPSQPLAFITVRLVQTSQEGLAFLELT